MSQCLQMSTAQQEETGSSPGSCNTEHKLFPSNTSLLYPFIRPQPALRGMKHTKSKNAFSSTWLQTVQIQNSGVSAASPAFVELYEHTHT